MSCPPCDGSAGSHDDRARTLVSRFGPIRYRRAYSSCRRRGQGLCPFDQQAGLPTRPLTPAVDQLTSLAGGVCDRFEKGAALLAERAGVPLSESTVERTSEAVGHGIADPLAEGILFGPAVVGPWHAEARGRTLASFPIDATGTRQQGPGGAAAEGRMAYVAGVYNPAPPDGLLPPGKPPPPLRARSLAGLYPLAERGPLSRRQAAPVGMEQADGWIALTDGGNGLEEFGQQNFNRPDLVVILDFYHAASYLEKLAKALHPQDEGEAKSQAEQGCRLLKDEGGALTLEVLRHWAWPARKSPALRAQGAKTEAYFSNNRHRREYPEYQAEGWQIGSGVVASACQTVVGQRLKGAGKRWGEEGAHAVCHVRALYRSEKGQWEAFWKRPFLKQASVQQLN